MPCLLLFPCGLNVPTHLSKLEEYFPGPFYLLITGSQGVQGQGVPQNLPCRSRSKGSLDPGSSLTGSSHIALNRDTDGETEAQTDALA